MLRLIVPILAILLGIVVALSFALSGNDPAPEQTPGTSGTPGTVETSSVDATTDTSDKPSDADATKIVVSDQDADQKPADTDADTDVDASPAVTETTTTAATATPETTEATPTTPETTTTTREITAPTSAGDLAGFKVREATSGEARVLGSDDPESGYLMQIDISTWGAGVKKITLSQYREHVDSDEPYVVMNAEVAENVVDFYPYAARSITINGTTVWLTNFAWDAGVIQTTDDEKSVTYTLTIEDRESQAVMQLVRRYTIRKGSYDLQISQRLINLTDEPLNVQFTTQAQIDLIPDDAAYLGDRRLFVTGYYNNAYDPNHLNIYTDRAFLGRNDVIGDGYIWPNPSVGGETELVWLASENRYFAVVTHPAIPQGATKTQEIGSLQSIFPTVGVLVDPSVAMAPNVDHFNRSVVFTLTTDTLQIQPGKAKNLDFAAYAGPRDRTIYDQFPYNILQLGQLIRYELGCFCTFQWLAQFLLAFLTFLHGIFGDWGVAIIILTCVVRLMLHPLTKKAQVNMMKMGKQMQAMQPEMEKLREKYKDNQQKLNQEMMKLYREKGVNPANMLGCLPMFLQMPIWVALYAMLYFAIELRHQPAFYNVFHNVSTMFGYDWQFLSDLSSPDHFIVFYNEPHIFPLLLIQFDFSAFNILPILMGGIFFFQQKFMTPPPANDQARQQQRMMQIMIVLLFPLMLYSAPSGLTLYILASTSIGVLDSWLVRRHVAKLEESGELFKKKERKPGGFVDRMSKAIEERQSAISNQKRHAPKKRKK